MQIPVDYVWLDSNKKFRWKTKVLINEGGAYDLRLDNIPEWNYDGSSCGQADGNGQTEVILKPVFMVRDPFRETGIVVLCETYKDGVPLQTNTRCFSKMVFDKAIDLKPWFGIEQEYFIIDPILRNVMGLPLPDFGQIPNSNEFYCKMGTKYGRNIAEQHLQYCLRAGLTVSGMNAEVVPGQWEYQIGPCEGIRAGDELMLSRYFLERIAEEHGKSICWNPKPIDNVNGSGCHTNFSTKEMRDEGGMQAILNAISYLQDKHAEHMEKYGTDNNKRMTGKHETASYNRFSFGYGTRNTSIRIGNDTAKKQKGYFEDRRPASNMDPYVVTSLLLKTSCQITI